VVAPESRGAVRNGAALGRAGAETGRQFARAPTRNFRDGRARELWGGTERGRVRTRRRGDRAAVCPGSDPERPEAAPFRTTPQLSGRTQPRSQNQDPQSATSDQPRRLATFDPRLPSAVRVFLGSFEIVFFPFAALAAFLTFRRAADFCLAVAIYAPLSVRGHPRAAPFRRGVRLYSRRSSSFATSSRRLCVAGSDFPARLI
jgi:hypothetical protein